MNNSIFSTFLDNTRQTKAAARLSPRDSIGQVEPAERNLWVPYAISIFIILLMITVIVVSITFYF